MTQKSETPPAELQKARAEGASEATGRLAALKSAFKDDLGFAVEAFEKGLTVEQAKAAYADVLAERVATLETETAELKAQAAKAAAAQAKAKADENAGGDGAAPIASEGSDGGEGDFLTQARALAKSEGISGSEARRRMARQKPELFEAFRVSRPGKAPKPEK